MAELNLAEAITFDDILLVPRRSDVSPAETETVTRFSRNIQLNIPVTSAAMDTVTEAHLAIAIAQQGGLGVIHRNMSIEAQRDEVDKVKRSESGMIVDPVTMTPNRPLSEALAVMARYKISGVPIVDEVDRLVGILTNRDLRFETRLHLSIGEVMTKGKLITAPVGTTLEQAKVILQEHRIEKLPVVDKENRLKGLITVKDIQKAIRFPNAAKDDLGRLRVGGAIGPTGDYLERATELVKARADALVVDTAHGHSARVMEAVRCLKAKFNGVDVVAGNVGTEEGARELIGVGADGIKVGMGPGSICTTRVVTGAGVPQITAILQCSRASREARVPLIADGGVKFSGDITKAIAAGADCVMIGSLFAGTEESPGETILYQGRTFKAYRGMGSLGAMRKGSADRYGFGGETSDSKLVPEGIEGRVPYKGSIAAMIEQLVGGLRSGMGYCGSRTIRELQEKAQFIRVTQASLQESHVHDVIITKEAPNYRLE